MRMKNGKLICHMLLIALICICCSGREVCAWNSYTNLEEMRTNMDWWEEYTMGTGQQLTVEQLTDVNMWDCQVMDENGNIWYDVEDFFGVNEYGQQVLSINNRAMESGTYYIVASVYKGGELIEGCVQIQYIKLREMPAGLAALIGTTSLDYSICEGLDFPYKVTYASSDVEVATVDSNGVVTPQRKAGDVTITATVEYPQQEPVTFTGLLDVTDPDIKDVVVVARKENLTLSIPGTSEYSSWYFDNNPAKTTFSNKKCSIHLYGDEEMGSLMLSITGKNQKKSQKITLVVDGKVLKFKIDFSNPVLKQEVLVVKKGKTLKAPVKGTKAHSVVTCEVTDEKIAFLNKKGKIKGKKVGNTWMSVDVDGKTFYVLLVVQKGKMYKVVKYAADQIGTAKYSQARRMDKGYYDCSSLVWRSYKAAGLNIGNTSWALNSDGFANYYYKKGKHYVGKKLKTNKKLKCGDIIIRGKYKKGKAQTHHAELYIGDGYVIEAGNYGVHLSTTVGADIAVRPWP